MMLATDLAVLDHPDGSRAAGRQRGQLRRHRRAGRRGLGRRRGAARRDDRRARRAARPSTVAVLGRVAEPSSRASAPRARSTRRCVDGPRRRIRDGDVFQVVLSQRFEIDCPADAARRLPGAARLNPSPYMYLLRLPTPGRRATFDVVGLQPGGAGQGQRRPGDHATRSPARGRAARPRSRGRALAEELLARPQGAGRAPHARRPGPQRPRPGVRARHASRCVDFMAVERYSHVMHLVSTVVGRPARRTATAFDVLGATFPAGTLSGAPEAAGDGAHRRARAHPARPLRRRGRLPRLRRRPRHGDRHPHRRCIRDGVAYVQAGAGIVADSDPEREYEECRNKAAAVLRAVATAATLRVP